VKKEEVNDMANDVAQKYYIDLYSYRIIVLLKQNGTLACFGAFF